MSEQVETLRAAVAVLDGLLVEYQAEFHQVSGGRGALMAGFKVVTTRDLIRSLTRVINDMTGDAPLPDQPGF